MEIDVVSDLILVKQLLGLSDASFSDALGITRTTLNRWINHESNINEKALERIYSLAYSKGIRINEIKSQFFEEESEALGLKFLFHGSKSPMDLPVDLTHSKRTNDVGVGFYCGETLEQSAMYCAGYKEGSVYMFTADLAGLRCLRLPVDSEWMIAIAYFRGRLKGYENSPVVLRISESVLSADCIIAPIADNKMFSIIDAFIDGELTDEQCKHCLSATDLGSQYVFRTEEAIKRLVPSGRLYLCQKEREDRLNVRQETLRLGNDKVKAARIKYAGKGQYIDSLLGGSQ